MDMTWIAVSDRQLEWLGIFHDICVIRDTMEMHPDALTGQVKAESERLLCAHDALIDAFNVIASHYSVQHEEEE